MIQVFAFSPRGRHKTAYSSALLAAMMRPVHDYDTPAGARPMTGVANCLSTDGLRVTVDAVEGARPVTLPEVSSVARVTWAILCARSVYQIDSFVDWTELWITGRDRSPQAAYEAMGVGGLVPTSDAAYVAHWATMAGAFPQDTTLAPQCCALIAANLFPSGLFNFHIRAEAALDLE